MSLMCKNNIIIHNMRSVRIAQKFQKCLHLKREYILKRKNIYMRMLKREKAKILSAKSANNTNKLIYKVRVE